MNTTQHSNRPAQIDQTILTEWRGIIIAIHHCPQWLGNEIEHLEIVSERPERAPLPITETGYLSHFLPFGETERHGGALAYVLDWLDGEAQYDDWQHYVASQQQLSLF